MRGIEFIISRFHIITNVSVPTHQRMSGDECSFTIMTLFGKNYFSTMTLCTMPVKPSMALHPPNGNSGTAWGKLKKVLLSTFILFLSSETQPPTGLFSIKPLTESRKHASTSN